MKFSENRRQNSRFKQSSATLLIIVVCSILCISMVSAWEFDNVKNQKDITFDGKFVLGNKLLEKYKPIEIKNSFGLGKTLFEGYISQHDEICGIDCQSTIEINLHEDGILIDDIIFKTLQENESWIEQNIRSYQLTANGKPYTIGDEVEAGVYTINLEGEKKPTRTVDWVIKTNGEWLESWATWGTNTSTITQEDSEQCSASGENFNVLCHTYNVNGYSEQVRVRRKDGAISCSSTQIVINYNNGSSSSVGTPYSSTTTELNLTNPHRHELIDNIETRLRRNTGSGCGSDTVYLYNSSLWTDENDSQVILNSPTDNYISNTNLITFNATATVVGGATITNMSLWTNKTGSWALRNTTIIIGTTNTTTWTRTITDNIIWNVQACDSDGDCGFATSNYTLEIDTSEPIINITYPEITMGYGAIGENETFNWTATDANIDTCWYEYNNTNTTVTCGDNTTEFTLVYGFTNITFYANDSVGNENSITRSWTYIILENSQTYNSSTYESSEESFEINFIYDSSEWLDVSATLYYNETGYEGDESGSGDDLTFNASVVTPLVDSDTNITFYWTIALTNTTGTYYYNSSFYNVIIHSITDIVITDGACGAGMFAAINYTFMDERNLTSLNANIKYNFKFGIGDLTANLVSGTFTDISDFKICINETIDSYKLGYGEIEYDLTGYVSRRYYMFEKQSLSNSTTNNITIYQLESAEATSFLFEIKNTFLNPYVDKLIGLLRWYPQDDEYKVVELAKTDEDGKTLMKVEEENVDYRIGVYELDGSLIKLAEPVRMVCLIDPCTYSLTIISDEYVYFDIYGIESSLTFDEDNNRFVYIWNDPSQLTSSMRLLVVKESGFQDVVICNSTGFGYTGVLTCGVGTYTGTLAASAYRTASPETILASLRETIGTFLNNDFGLLAAWLLMLIAAFAGVWSPIAAIILSLPGLILAVIFGTINFTIFMGIVVLAGIIIHMIKKTR